MRVAHSFVSAIPDNPAHASAGKVVSSNWNADHVIEFAGADVVTALGYTPASLGANTFTGTQTLGATGDNSNPLLGFSGTKLLWRGGVVEAGTADFGCALTLHTGSNGETRQDNVLTWGYNVAASGGRFNSGEHQFAESVESRYKTSEGVTQLEHYWNYTSATGYAYRPFSQTINLTDDLCIVAVRGHQFRVGHPDGENDWARFSCDATTAALVFYGGTTINYLGTTADFFQAGGNGLVGYDSTYKLRLGGGLVLATLFPETNLNDTRTLEWGKNIGAGTVGIRWANNADAGGSAKWQIKDASGSWKSLVPPQTIYEATDGSGFVSTGIGATPFTPNTSYTLTLYEAGASASNQGTNMLIRMTDFSYQPSVVFDIQQEGGTSAFKIDRDGIARASAFRDIDATIQIAGNSLQLGKDSWINWTSATAPYSGTRDLYLYRDAAGNLALRNSTNAQAFRVYGTYSDSSNYLRASLAATSADVTLAAETAGTGADNVPINITPAGAEGTQFTNFLQLTEMTAPSAGAANTVRLYADDNGSGKTRLMALFSSGAAAQVAIQP